MFRVGQKVVCIHRSGKGDLGHEVGPYSKPNFGGIYTIATINEWPRGTIITLVECDNSHLIGVWRWGSLEPGFGAEHFRSIVERKTDVSIFTKMLKTKHITEPAR